MLSAQSNSLYMYTVGFVSLLRKHYNQFQSCFYGLSHANTSSRRPCVVVYFILLIIIDHFFAGLFPKHSKQSNPQHSGLDQGKVTPTTNDL